jgi:hypothetical protein
MDSKIIQISAVAVGDSPYVYALCEDGTVWRKFGLSGEWKLATDDKPKKRRPLRSGIV